MFSKRKVPGKPNKITDGWTGPYRVVAKPAEVLLEVTHTYKKFKPQI